MLLKLCTADVMYVMRYMDNVVSNPYEVWRQMSSPDYPTLQQLAQLRGQEVIHTHTPLLEFQDTCTSAVCVCFQDAQTDGPIPVPAQGYLSLRVKLPVPSILLIHLCARPTHTPGQVNTNVCFLLLFTVCLCIIVIVV